MPNYIKQALHKFKHALSPKSEDAPHKLNQLVYAAKQKLADAKDDSPVLPLLDITYIQTVVGTLFYYFIAVDNTILVALGDLASLQTKGTQKTLDALTQLLNYASTHPNATVCFQHRGISLHIHSEGS